MKGLYLDEIWNLFCNLMAPRPQNRTLAVLVDESVDKKQLEEEIYKLVPTANIHVCWFEDLNDEPFRSCKIVSFERLTRCRAEDDEYPNLKKLIGLSTLYQLEFYGPEFLNWDPDLEFHMSLAQMEELAKKFSKDWGCE
jgi:hypothetical protein